MRRVRVTNRTGLMPLAIFRQEPGDPRVRGSGLFSGLHWSIETSGPNEGYSTTPSASGWVAFSNGRIAIFYNEDSVAALRALGLREVGADEPVEVPSSGYARQSDPDLERLLDEEETVATQARTQPSGRWLRSDWSTTMTYTPTSFRVTPLDEQGQLVDDLL